MAEMQPIIRRTRRSTPTRTPAKSEKRKVVVHNDDVTTFDFVVRMLMDIFFMNLEEAQKTTIDIDRDGSAVVGTYPKDIAESKAEAGMAMARAENFPLRITTQNA